jgi:hypothetical protein
MNVFIDKRKEAKKGEAEKENEARIYNIRRKFYSDFYGLLIPTSHQSGEVRILLYSRFC